MFNNFTTIIRTICTTQVTPSERLGIISRGTHHDHSNAGRSECKALNNTLNNATIQLADGTRIPATMALLAEYYRDTADLATPSLNAMDTRSPSYRDIIAYLIDTSATPATTTDIREAYLALYDHLPSEFELETTIDRVRQFGLTAETQHS
ncbi:hypothetical protein GC425_04795 [Corynebacterium sp. zg254]|uniref:Uncharacterized protein n=1 Tax=Corynebacterium zhongnanshanii TaxID=2768834 RepID=A0ABQ6VE95_9CORY|nr:MULTISPECIES: hypothetical protein [Corynebacterium]KAB1554269.1 hypothetical protein F7232_04780 [Corynebacterium sp. 319]KAB3522757.1 hypothetical protein F8377_00820 [Corynebacterium zhongnanshanii]KAB3539987.1 hypothetical protein F8390_01550 [Corynebacterium sp. 366]MCR5914184.1 hypothetical protein [Corynebacterium sp. zg254]